MKPGKINDLNHLYAIVRGQVKRFYPHIWGNEIITRADGKTKEDVVQEVMLSLMEKHVGTLPFTLEEATPKYVRLRSFQTLVDLYRKTNKIPDHIRVEIPQLEDLMGEDAGFDPVAWEDVLEYSELFNKLTKKNFAIMSNVAMGYSYKEISELLAMQGYNLTPESIRTRVSLIRKQWREADE